jgi:hypothetical protein
MTTPRPQYAAVSAAITVALTGLPVDSPPQLAAATAALIVTLVALGLLVRNAGTGAFSWLVILAWALVGHALLVRVATRREL